MDQQQAVAKATSIIRSYLPDPSYRVFLFGSRVAGYARKFSDIDIGIEGPAPVAASVLMRIEEDMEESDIPYIVEVVDFTAAADSFRKFARRNSISL